MKYFFSFFQKNIALDPRTVKTNFMPIKENCNCKLSFLCFSVCI
ncbi:hypothetical protein FEDK69T_13970 [Flavobacterium enshiense DK69]|nr:hypothetical protein FEDK69T_13970 [Flavobacterium enshiense DK69]